MYVSSWRPITLLNVDYKIITKCLTNRLLGIMPDLINADQTGFMPGRTIGTNIRISFFQDQEEGGLVVSLDFAKAFDSVDRDFIHEVLKSLNFGEKFLKWIKILYSKAESCVINNGHSSGWFEMNAGLRQGCALLPFLFILTVEKLAEYVRNDTNVKGVSISRMEYKLSQYADDTTILVRDG